MAAAHAEFTPRRRDGVAFGAMNIECLAALNTKLGGGRIHGPAIWAFHRLVSVMYCLNVHFASALAGIDATAGYQS